MIWMASGTPALSSMTRKTMVNASPSSPWVAIAQTWVVATTSATTRLAVTSRAEWKKAK